MSDKSQSAESPDLVAVVEGCLPKLQAVSLALDTYGSESNASTLHLVIEQLQKAVPVRPSRVVDSMDFVVNATFTVSRGLVAGTLWRAFGSEINWFRVVEVIEPPMLRFRSIERMTLRLVDYPLNEGGSLGIVTNEPASNVFRLDLEAIAQGLEVMASKYPRHFADLVNENTDAITADVLLQCCLFGELIYN